MPQKCECHECTQAHYHESFQGQMDQALASRLPPGKTPLDCSYLDPDRIKVTVTLKIWDLYT